jgi:hypothetical protein
MDHWRKISYTQIKVCICVEMGWSWLLHSNDSFSILYMRAGLVFFLDYGPKCVLTFFYGPSCVHIFFLFNTIAHASFMRMMEKIMLASIYLVEMERHVFAYFPCRSIAYIWWSISDLDLKSMIEFSTQVNKVWQNSKQRQVAYVEGFQYISRYLALVENLTIKEKWGC